MSEPVPERSDVSPEVGPDDTDRGWGERVAEADPDDLDRFLADRPPHHGDV
jgi:hypothetical protein